MVILVLTKNGFKEMESIIKDSIDSIWVSEGVLSEKELEKYRMSGVDITDFSYKIEKSNSEEIQGALSTIKEHHPDQNIWIEQ